MNLTALSIRRPSLIIVVFAVLMFMGVSSLFFHQLRLRVALDPTLADKIAVYYLVPGSNAYSEVKLAHGNELHWPLGFQNDLFEKEVEINTILAKIEGERK